MAKVLMINGSPKKGGCTFTALTEVGKGLADYAVAYEIMHIGTQPISGCIDCGGCRKEGAQGCVLPDSTIVNDCIKRIEAADGLVVGSPVYFASANGSLVSLLDRVFFGSDHFAGKPAAAVVSARRAGTTAALDQLHKYFMLAEMPVVTSSYWNMVHGFNPEQVAQDAEGLQTMRNLGRNMGWLIRSIEAGRNSGVEPPATEYGSFTNFIS